MFFLLLFIPLWGVSLSEPSSRTCEPIQVEMCKDLGYNFTGMPNLGGNDMQLEADYNLKSFDPLIRFGCSQHLKWFLCSVYVPMCNEKVLNPIGPCRAVCEGVRSRCFPVMQGFGFPWPDALNCSRFPVTNTHEHMCMEGPKDEIDIRAPVNPAVRKFECDENDKKSGLCPPSPCETKSIFDESEKKLAEVWMTVWTVICLVTSLGSVLTMSIGGGRVKARPLLSLGLCYVFVSIGWAMRIFAGKMSTTCSKELEDSVSNINCTFVFMLLYYFGMAANAWWVCLCAWWVARVGLSWPSEKMRHLGSVFHLCAWGFPAIQTVTALIRRDIDTDELTETCYIGNTNTKTLLAFVFIPQFIYFFVGILLLVLGCNYYFRKPRTSTTAVAAPLTNAPPRKESDFLGAICILYAVPTFCVMAVTYYEYANKEKWLSGVKKPALWAFLMKFFMALFIGTSSVFWIWSMKRMNAWKAVLKRMGPRKQPPLKIKTVPQVLRYMPSQTLAAPSNKPTKHCSGRVHAHRKPRVHHMRPGNETVI